MFSPEWRLYWGGVSVWLLRQWRCSPNAFSSILSPPHSPPLLIHPHPGLRRANLLPSLTLCKYYYVWGAQGWCVCVLICFGEDWFLVTRQVYTCFTKVNSTLHCTWQTAHLPLCNGINDACLSMFRLDYHLRVPISDHPYTFFPVCKSHLCTLGLSTDLYGNSI